MEKKVLSYKIVIEKEGDMYNAYCQTLGLAEYGESINQVTKRMKEMIQFHIDSLTKLGEEVPVEKDDNLVTSVQVSSSSKAKLSYV